MTLVLFGMTQAQKNIHVKKTKSVELDDGSCGNVSSQKQ